MKRFIFFLLAILILPIGMAALDDAEAYYSFDNVDTSGSTSIDISGNANNGTLNGGVTTGVTGILNEAYSFDGTDDYVESDNNLGITGSSPRSLSFWVKTDGSGNDIQRVIMLGTFTGGNGEGYGIRFDYQKPEDRIILDIGNGNAKWEYDIDDNNLHHVVLTSKDSDLANTKLYIDGVEQTQLIADSTNIDTLNNELYIGNQEGSGFEFTGSIDEPSVYSWELNSSEVSELYNNGNGFNPFKNNNNFTVTAVDAFTNTSIQNFSVNISYFNSTAICPGFSCPTQTFQGGTTNGTVVTNITDGFTLENFSFSAVGYQDRDYFNQSLSSGTGSFEGRLLQAESKFTEAISLVSEQVLTSFNVTIQGQTFQSNTTFTSPAQYNATFSKDGWYNKTEEYNQSSLNQRFTNVYDSKLTINVEDQITTNPFNNYTATLTHQPTSYTETQNTTNGTVTFNLETNKTYNVTINSPEIPLQTVNVLVENQTQTLTIQTLKERSVLFKYIDTETQDTINTVTSTVTNLDTENTVTNTSTNGETYYQLLTPGKYRTVHNATGYQTNQYYITVTPDASNTYTFSLTQNTSALPVTITVLDQATNPLEGILLSIQRYYPSNNTYRTITEQLTNFQGQATTSPPDDEEYYRIQFTGTNQEILETTEPFQIREDTYTFTLNTDPTSSLEEYYEYRSLKYNLTYNNQTENFKATYTQNGEQNKVCLETRTEKTTMPDTIHTQNCETSSSGVILIPRQNENTTQTARLTYTTKTDNYLVDTITKNFQGTASLGTNGLIAQIILTLLIISISLTLTPSTLLITVPASILLGWMIGLHTIPIYTTIGLLVAGITSLYAVNRRQGAI